MSFPAPPELAYSVEPSRCPGCEKEYPFFTADITICSITCAVAFFRRCASESAPTLS